ncbi:NAD(P)H-dependent oxidoreductase [Algoriphagus zhangzhouensis]|uniref:Putative NADPH-quinone reductase (Modulator of drug activity B) n=1 Tax=Algoriphagus zhangzhouensis TaxID=1073327 RepID=A0A1M7ZDG0_9BACT|nr:NAD(P)H-dependent oxidoreductase [Algoriphagus zhangzhouensis]TDY45763.1 putative NADPH-quinone reductase [Algoriphagus zhangzhouensis]SHO62862.1 Putative NADPH-quinone reductase (modulator of drug activity B) [Algoriphagus zhangzhouensis]
MRVTIIFNHPYEGSYCNAILETVSKGLRKANHEIDLIHLDNDQFNPVMTSSDLKAFRDKSPVDPKVLEYKEKLEKADHLIFIFPIWWELMPAMTKGFIDKVIFPGVAYDYTNKENTRMKPLFNKIKGVTVITTMNTPKLLYRLFFGNAIKKALILGTFWKIGYKNRKWISFNNVKKVSQEKRIKWLEGLETRFSSFA